VRILVASTEIGQGTNTILCQIAADALGIDFALVEIARPTRPPCQQRTDRASRTCMIVGKLVETAGVGVEANDGPVPAGGPPLRAFSQYTRRQGYAGTMKYQGDAYGAFTWPST